MLASQNRRFACAVMHVVRQTDDHGVELGQPKKLVKILENTQPRLPRCLKLPLVAITNGNQLQISLRFKGMQIVARDGAHPDDADSNRRYHRGVVSSNLSDASMRYGLHKCPPQTT